jgi:HlyD family secretion protein
MVRFVKKRPLIFLVLVLAVVVVGIGTARLRPLTSETEPANGGATFVVRRGPLRISVTESGTLRAREQVIMKSEVDGRTSILYIIAEGTHVKKGDLLVELDASKLEDDRIDQQIRVQNVEASYIGVKENLAVVKNQAQSDVDLAELALKFARQDLKKYKEGDYPNRLREAEAQITLADEELKRAEEKLNWSKKLFDEKYISRTELQADQLAFKKAELNLELAKNSRELLEKFTYQRNIDQLNSDVRQAEMALERTKRKASADVARAEANLKAKESEYNRQQDKLKKIEEQIEKAKIYAPSGGQVIYASSAKPRWWRSSAEPLDVGSDVREREELIYLPTTSAVKAEVDIHEASLKKVKVGLPAIVTTDALPGRAFSGRVAQIAPLPNAESVWINPDLKVYKTEVFLDSNDPALRTGMSCQVEVIIEEYKDAIYVPVQAVLRVSGEPTVYIVKGKKLEPRVVQIGLDNNRMVRILSGLSEGEVVSLTPPLEAASADKFSEAVTGESMMVDRPEETKGRSQDRESQRKREPQGASEKDMQKMQEKLKSMSPEEKEKMRERMKNMSTEERDKMRQRQEQGGK